MRQARINAWKPVTKTCDWLRSYLSSRLTGRSAMERLVKPAMRVPGPTHIGLAGTAQSAETAVKAILRERRVNFEIRASPKRKFPQRPSARILAQRSSRADPHRRGWSTSQRPATTLVSRTFCLMLHPTISSIESRRSWAVAVAALVTMLMAFGAAWIVAVALKDIAAEVDGIRSIPALAVSLAWLGSGAGGILMGRLADKIGTRWTIVSATLMIGLGLVVSTLGPHWPLWIGHGLFIGLIGLGGVNAPMYIYISRWFDRRRGSALALISSGSYLAGAMWPPLFERAIVEFGWRQTMLWYGALEMAVIVPLALIYFSAPPEVIHPATPADRARGEMRVLGWPPNVVFAVMC